MEPVRARQQMFSHIAVNRTRAVLVGALWALGPGPVAAQTVAPEDPVVRGLAFSGNRAIDDYTLRNAIATSQSSWPQRYPIFRLTPFGEKRYFDEIEFQRDVIRLGLLYRQSGYFETRIDTVVRRSNGDVRIRFVIDEGEPVRVTALGITGAETIMPEAAIRRELPLQAGDPFNRFWLQASADTIRSLLANRGYPFVDVFSGFDEDRPARQARVSFTVEPGPASRVDSVLVNGTSEINPVVVLRAASVRANQPFRLDALAETQRDLYATDLFSSVAVRVADSLRSGAVDSSVTIVIDVSEGQLRRARAGAGWGALDCFRGLAGWTARNFAGGGRTLDLTAQVSKIASGGFPGCSDLVHERDSSALHLNYNIALAFHQPHVVSRRNSATFSVFAERRSEINAYLREARGGEIAFVRQLGWRAPLTISYSLARGKTVAHPAVFCSFLGICSLTDTVGFFGDWRRESTLGVSVMRDWSNSPLDPSRGGILNVQIRYASPAIGSDSLSQFAKWQMEHSAYHRVGRRSVFAWRIRGGMILPSRLSLFTQRARFVPPAERLYAGGPSTVRGFGQNGLGPIVRVISSDGDTVTAASGGNQLVVGNLELRVPLPVFAGRLGGAVFLDAGGLWTPNDGAAVTPQFPDGFRVTPGVGVRLTTPLGPMRLDVAYNSYPPTAGPLYRISGLDLVLENPNFTPAPPQGFLDRLKLHFSVGQAF